MRAALYHRVSTVDQNPEAAHAELRAAARQRGHEIVIDVVEQGSGANNDRPGMGDIFAAARRGRVDLVMVWKLDRFGRSALDLLTNIRALITGGVCFSSVTQGIDVPAGGDAIAQLNLTILAAFAEFERTLIRERTLAGLANARRKGVKLGRPRTGPDSHDVRTLRADGLRWEEIAVQLGCTVNAARGAYARCGKGGSKS
jgi:putative DNA-invertase from lambdoid prophage Rac